MIRKKQNPVFFLQLEDLRIEVVLDKGFWGIHGGDSRIHSHSYYELMLSTGKGFSLELEKETLLPLTGGTACLIPPGVFHRVLGNDQKLSVRFLCTPASQSRTLFPAFSSAVAAQTRTLPLGKQPELLELTGKLRRELQGNYLGKEPCIQSLLTQFFVLLLRVLCNSPSLPQNIEDTSAGITARRLAIEDFLYQNYKMPITEADMAEHLHLSKRQLSRVLQQLYGMSFRQMLVDVRLNHAARLLRDTTIPTEQVASMVGYSSLSGFYDAFRKKFAIPAGQYRKLS